MNARTYGPLTILALIISVGVGAYFSYNQHLQRKAVYFSPSPISTNSGTTKQQLESLKLLSPPVKLSADDFAQIAPYKLDLSMLGYSQSSIQAFQNAEYFKQVSSIESFQHHNVSMTFVTDSNKYAIVDGNLRKEGDHISSSGQLIKITPKKVLVGNSKIQNWIPVTKSSRVYKPKEIARKTQKKSATSKSEANSASEKKGTAEELLEQLKTYSDLLNSVKSQLNN